MSNRLFIASTVLTVFLCHVRCSPKRHTQTTTSASNESGFEVTAKQNTVLTSATIALDDSNDLCAIAKGTVLRLKSPPKESASDDSGNALVELLSPAPAADPIPAGLPDQKYANKTSACPNLRVWLPLNEWTSPDLRSSKVVSDVILDATDEPLSDPKSGKKSEKSGTTESNLSDCCSFPLKKRVPTCDEAGWGIGAFGAFRGGGTRLHAGCDLYGYVGQSIYAIADGVVITSPYSFYCDTDALEVQHGSRIVRYGEIRAGSARFAAGQSIKRGQKIAEVGRLSCYYQPMIHFELFSGKSSGPLSTSSGPYRRRGDLQNPTRKLKVWRENLP